MSALIITATITAKPDAAGRVKSDLLAIVAKTRHEPGCLRYDLHMDNDAPAVFFIYEIWETQAHWAAHDGAPALQAKMREMEKDIDSVSVRHLTRVD